ncbi:hypothetical protein ABD91_21250 [Lysinibacillus sphaericus]|uniref:hypothetical protein n=1 Tax=Lysinibacillus sphaericus TaxID=1421 RepID=UPI0018CE85E8|nr:hypothetical protein [Lysinibacillus sphaericus]MBG9693266.1 hypothetical protein [Lysinibacillus sphaericus]
MDEKILQALAVLKDNKKNWFRRTKIVEYCRDGDWLELSEDQPIRLLLQYEIRIVDHTPK